MGIVNVTNVTMDNINNIINITSGDPTEFLLRTNHYIYGGWFFFIMLCLLGILLFRKAQQKQDQPLINIMYISTLLTIISFFMRAMFLVVDGVTLTMVTDFQMWIFPLIVAISIAMIKYGS